jgi:hypothetical protein
VADCTVIADGAVKVVVTVPVVGPAAAALEVVSEYVPVPPALNGPVVVTAIDRAGGGGVMVTWSVAVTLCGFASAVVAAETLDGMTPVRLCPTDTPTVSGG